MPNTPPPCRSLERHKAQRHQATKHHSKIGLINYPLTGRKGSIIGGGHIRKGIIEASTETVVLNAPPILDSKTELMAWL